MNKEDLELLKYIRPESWIIFNDSEYNPKYVSMGAVAQYYIQKGNAYVYFKNKWRRIESCEADIFSKGPGRFKFNSLSIKFEGLKSKKFSCGSQCWIAPIKKEITISILRQEYWFQKKNPNSIENLLYGDGEYRGRKYKFLRYQRAKKFKVKTHPNYQWFKNKN